LEINSELLNKPEINILLYKINPISIKYIVSDNINEEVKDNLLKYDKLSLTDIIFEYIKDNDKLVNQFNKIKEIYKRN
jgi:hypothetical protein